MVWAIFLDLRISVFNFYVLSRFYAKIPKYEGELNVGFANGLPSGSPIVIDSNTGLPNIASRYVYQKEFTKL